MAKIGNLTKQKGQLQILARMVSNENSDSLLGGHIPFIKHFICFIVPESKKMFKNQKDENKPEGPSGGHCVSPCPAHPSSQGSWVVCCGLPPAGLTWPHRTRWRPDFPMAWKGIAWNTPVMGWGNGWIKDFRIPVRDWKCLLGLEDLTLEGFADQIFLEVFFSPFASAVEER